MDTRRMTSAALLAAFCCGTLLPAVAFRGLAGMEFRTALFVRELLRHGPSLIPRLDGAPYFDYPPLYFLVAAFSSRLLGAISPLSLALPSMLAAAGTAVLVLLMAGGRRANEGLAAGAALAVTPLLLVCASQANVDAMLVFFITLALAGCRRRVLSGGRGALFVACLGLAGALCTKGPIGAAIPLCAAAAWLVARRRFRLLAGLFVPLGIFLAALAAAAAAAVCALEGREALAGILNAQLFDRVSDEANQSRLYYLGVFFGAFAPWSLLATGRLFRRLDPARADLDSFCASWFLSTLLLLSLASVKHSRYLLPAAPPVALLAASLWGDLCAPGGPPRAAAAVRLVRRCCLVLLASGAAFGALGPLLLPFASPILWAAVPAACLAPLLAPPLRRGDGAYGVFLLAAWTMAAGFAAYCQFDTPRMVAKEEARTLVREIERAADGDRIVFYRLGKDTDGLKFLYWREKDNPLAFADSLPGLAEILDEGPPSLLVVRNRDRETVEGAFGPRLRILVEGRLGKRRCAVFRTAQ
ncbi:MAG: glycosyltransferase family 39 protein [Candidatus Aureabacteria bacterium]|nr:glycosyltransferase family 39 protein [Candidatus Auribacterota bacterium]HOE26751.1 glycosyltransferase family 39 protein [bacterium]HQM51732.1 glycosyltransferase family 39 protein [bacterium]